MKEVRKEEKEGGEEIQEEKMSSLQFSSLQSLEPGGGGGEKGGDTSPVERSEPAVQN